MNRINTAMLIAVALAVTCQIGSVWLADHQRQHITDCKLHHGTPTQTQDELICIGGHE